jgi:UPF0271 protein
MTIHLSCDLGEATEADTLAVEARIWPLITSANIACGGHVGDEASMRAAVESAIEHGVTIGAHPSYPDRESFGRKSMSMDPQDLRASLGEQMRNLGEIAARAGGRLVHAKPHGALYNDAHTDEGLAEIIVEACMELGLTVVTSSGSAVERAAAARECPVLLEGFADRRYRNDGSLVPRTEPDALILDFTDAAMQAVRLAKGKSVVSSEGREIRIPCDTICIHSDMEGSVERLERIRTMLDACGVAIAREG